MMRQVEAVYEKGALRPLEPLPLRERQRVVVTISDSPAEAQRSQLDRDYIEGARKEVARLGEIPSLQEVQRLLSKISGSWGDSIGAGREDR